MKISNTLVKGKVEEILPYIFCVKIDDDYDRAMLFCRYQEFYESPIKKIRGLYFSWEMFMKEYKNFTKKPYFSYPQDWAGYNIPSTVLEEAIDVFYCQSLYDTIMYDIYTFCEERSISYESYGIKTPWYLIGASSKDLHTMNHEIAHGLYFTDQEYKKNVNELIKQISKKDYNNFKKILISMGYVNKKHIIEDEMQAFLSTGLYNDVDIKSLKKYEKEFKKNFKKFQTK